MFCKLVIICHDYDRLLFVMSLQLFIADLCWVVLNSTPSRLVNRQLICIQLGGIFDNLIYLLPKLFALCFLFINFNPVTPKGSPFDE